MDGWSRDKIIQIIASDMDSFNRRKEEIKRAIDEQVQENIEYLDALLKEITASKSGPLIPKTPKVFRKRNLKRIETIPEDAMMEISHVASDTTTTQEQDMELDAPPETGRRSKREASKKAGDIIKQQQSITLTTKLRRPSNDENDISCHSKASSRGSRSKRPKPSLRSSDEDEPKRPAKHVKTEDKIPGNSTQNKSPSSDESTFTEEEITQPKSKKLASMKRKHESNESKISNRPSSLKSMEPDIKKANIVDETFEAPSADDTIEPSMYEDAIGKAVPIMNSTMNPVSAANVTHTINQTLISNEARSNNPTANETRTINSNANEPLARMMNVTVVLEPFKKMNETVRVSKSSKSSSISRSAKNANSAADNPAEKTNERNHSPFSAPLTAPKITLSKLQPVVEIEALITDDDSSPERKVPRNRKMQKKCSVMKTNAVDLQKEAPVSKPKRITRSSLISEDEVDVTPGRKVLGEMNVARNKKGSRNGYKNQLFSPYAKESVRKRVEAFEQAVLASPVLEPESGMRLTRTKTRALAAAENGEQNVPNAPTIAQKLARKSLLKAKQISRAKEAKEIEESKENHAKLVTSDKLTLKQQLRTTPTSKIRPPMPSSVSRIQTTPSNTQSLSNYSKTMTGSRTNIVTNLDSFIQSKGSAKKPSSADKLLEEKRRRQNEEDAKRKREEALKAQTEEKKRRREEKERKNRLAREAKEKMEIEKRIRAEREREEKAKLAQLAQEKQREEAERKRIAQIQRAQEKDEKRRQEEQLRMQRLQEQEEMERHLAEQKRREQEAEKRRIAEVKAAEALKMKALMLAAQNTKAKLVQQQQQQKQLTSYKIDSEPDSDSDDELRPKHEIPSWAKHHYRQKHLAMQEYIPMKAIMRLFDVKKCTPDLSELFHGIDKNRLKRTSSAIWKTPPRFSMMEALN